MDFYSELRAIVEQIPRGRIAFLTDIAGALGDRAAVVALPRALEHVAQECEAVARVTKADGSVVLPESVPVLVADGVKVVNSRVIDATAIRWSDFVTSHPLRALRKSQLRCAKKIVFRDGVRKPKTLAGVDASYEGDTAYAAAVLLEAGTLDMLGVTVRKVDVDFPYIPGYLAFREMPAFLAALRAMPSRPDVLFVDGHGTLHPAECGIASLIGRRMGLPTIGIGKSRLVGEVTNPSLEIGQASPVTLGGIVRGYALRASQSTKPIYVSTGDRISPRTALAITRMACRNRIPEPIRLADTISHKEKMKNKKMVEKVPMRQK